MCSQRQPLACPLASESIPTLPSSAAARRHSLPACHVPCANASNPYRAPRFADETPEAPGVGSLALSPPPSPGLRGAERGLNLEPGLQGLLPAAQPPPQSLGIDLPPFHWPTHIPALPASCVLGLCQPQGGCHPQSKIPAR